MEQTTLLALTFTPSGMWEIEVPFLPKSKNVWEGMPHLHRRGERLKWGKHLDNRLLELAIPRADRIRVEIELHFCTNNRRDWQNYVHPLYWFVADALVRCGVIDDDDPSRFTTLENAGISFVWDRRTYLPKEQRQKTVVRIFTEEAA